MYSVFLLDLPVASSLLFEAVKKAEKKCKGSRRESFFFIAEEEVEKATLFVAFFRRALTLIHTYTHIDTDTHTCLLTLARAYFCVQVVKVLR